jgi:uncharacterized protein YfaP (DUF2135 family)
VRAVDWQALATIATAVRNSRAARREQRDQSYIKAAEKRAVEAEDRMKAADTSARNAERHAQQTELRAERSEWRLARLEQNEQLSEIELQRVSTAAQRMAAWIAMVVEAAEEGTTTEQLRRLINGGPPEAIPFRKRQQ